MAVKFYRKSVPKQKFFTSSGEWLRFDTIDPDVGVAAITDEKVQADIATATRENRGGITEITGEEYSTLQGLKKNESSTPPKRRWREEFSRQQVSGATAILPTGDPISALAAGDAANRHERVTKVAEAAKPTPRKK